MQRTTNLSFRQSSEDIRPLIPTDLLWISDRLSDSIPAGGGTPYSNVFNLPITMEQYDRIIEWGRTIVDGKSIVKGARLNESYDRSDLTDDAFFQIDGTASVSIANELSAFQGHWTCTRCRRPEWEQTEALELEDPDPLADLLAGDKGDWIIAAHLAPLLDRFRVRHRPVKNSEEYVQVIPGGICILDLSDPSIEVMSLCPKCERPDLFRPRDIVKGSAGLSPIDTITLFYQAPLALRGAEPPEVTLAISDQPFGNFQPFVPSDANDLDIVFDVETVNFIEPLIHFGRGQFVRELLDAGVSLRYRPVKWTAPAAENSNG